MTEEQKQEVQKIVDEYNLRMTALQKAFDDGTIDPKLWEEGKRILLKDARIKLGIIYKPDEKQTG